MKQNYCADQKQIENGQDAPESALLFIASEKQSYP
jgi:hypothetical protein